MKCVDDSPLDDLALLTVAVREDPLLTQRLADICELPTGPRTIEIERIIYENPSLVVDVRIERALRLLTQDAFATTTIDLLRSYTPYRIPLSWRRVATSLAAIVLAVIGAMAFLQAESTTEQTNRDAAFQGQHFDSQPSNRNTIPNAATSLSTAPIIDHTEDSLFLSSSRPFRKAIYQPLPPISGLAPGDLRESTVGLIVTIASDGRVSSARIATSSGSIDVDSSIVRYVSRWRYERSLGPPERRLIYVQI